MEQIFLGIVRIQEAKYIQSKLNDLNIKTNMISNPQTCTTGGCAITVELWGYEKDKESIANFFSQEMKKNIEGHNVNFDALSEVFDPNASEVICQACGTKFSPTLNECPDCGLVYY